MAIDWDQLHAPAERVTRVGFVWGQALVERVSSVARKNGCYRVIRVNDIHIYVSPTGRTRVFRGGAELVPASSKVPAKRPKQVCPECGRKVSVRTNGRLYVHGRNGMGFVCRG